MYDVQEAEISLILDALDDGVFFLTVGKNVIKTLGRGLDVPVKIDVICKFPVSPPLGREPTGQI